MSNRSRKRRTGPSGTSGQANRSLPAARQGEGAPEIPSAFLRAVPTSDAPAGRQGGPVAPHAEDSLVRRRLPQAPTGPWPPVDGARMALADRGAGHQPPAGKLAKGPRPTPAGGVEPGVVSNSAEWTDPPAGRSWPRLLRRRPESPVQVGSTRWRLLDALEPQSIPLTYWFKAPTPSRAGTAPEPAEPALVSLRVTGGRRPPSVQPEHYAEVPVGTSRDRVDEVYRLDVPLPPETLVGWTIRVRDLTPGLWNLTATPTLSSGPGAKVAVTGRTVFTPVAQNIAPGARIGAWPSLVALGALAGLLLQHELARRSGLAAGLLSLVTVLGCLVGLAGAKVYYLLTHPRQSRSLLTTGLSVQGFVLGVLGALGVGMLIWNLPPGDVLDVSAPGLLAGLAVGRLGCLCGGCCVGRPTSSRWGIWSSDRTVGVRRIPVQLLESAAAAALASATLAVLLLAGLQSGLVLVAGLSSYVLVRQLLFPLRALERATRHGRHLTLVVSAAVSVVSVAALAVAV